MLLERLAFARLTRLLSEPTEGGRRQAIRAGIWAYNHVGITAIREPELTVTDVRPYQAVVPQAQVLRASLMWRVDLSTTPEQRQAWLQGLAPISGFGHQWPDIWGLKVLLDGGVAGGYFRALQMPIHSKEDWHEHTTAGEAGAGGKLGLGNFCNV